MRVDGSFHSQGLAGCNWLAARCRLAVWPIVGWLALRGLILSAEAVETRGSVRTWTALSGGMDFLLAMLLLTGLSVSTIVVSVFGPTRELVAASDTNLASIGYHFGSKAGLLNAAIELSFHDWAEQLAQHADVVTEGLVRIRRHRGRW